MTQNASGDSNKKTLLSLRNHVFAAVTGSAIGMALVMHAAPHVIPDIVEGGSEISMRIPNDINTRAVVGRIDQKDVCVLAETWLLTMNRHLKDLSTTDKYSEIDPYTILAPDACKKVLELKTGSKSKDVQDKKNAQITAPTPNP